MPRSTSRAKATLVRTAQHKGGISPTVSSLVIKSPTSHLQHRKSTSTWPLWVIIPRLAFCLSIKRWVNIGCSAEKWQRENLDFFHQRQTQLVFCADEALEWRKPCEVQKQMHRAPVRPHWTLWQSGPWTPQQGNNRSVQKQKRLRGKLINFTWGDLLCLTGVSWLVVNA